MKSWKILKNESVYTVKPWFEVMRQSVQLPNGRIIDDFYQILQPDYVEIVAMNDHNQILGMWHYKHGVQREHLSLPAGYLEENELPLQAAQRELLEECQLVSEQWLKLGAFVMEGNRGPAQGHIFWAKNCKYSPLKLDSDDIEESRLEWLSIDHWLQGIENGKVAVIGAATAILLTHYEMKKARQ